MAYEKKCIRIKKEKFPLMQEQFRYFMDGVTEDCLQEQANIDELATMDLTPGDIQIVWDVRDKLFDILDPEAIIENDVVLSAIQSIFDAQPMIDLRAERDHLLGLTDWTQLPDVPEATQIIWQEYRQALRDITNTYTSLEDVIWPTKPGA